MGFLSGLANISPIGQFNNLFGSNSFNNSAKWGLKPGDNVGGNFGHSLNLWSGQTDSANLQYAHNMSLQHDAQNFAKWQMNNAHQAEVADLQKAGLNPVLSSGGTGADAGGVSAVSTGAGGATGDPLGAIMGIIGALNNTKQTQSIVDKTEAEVRNLDADTKNKGQQYDLQPEIVNAMTKLQQAQAGKAKAETATEVAKKLALDFENQMRKMNVDKRSSEFAREKMIYQKEMTRALTLAGYSNKTIDLAFSKFGERIKQLSPLADWEPNISSSTYNYSPVNVSY